MRGSDKRILRKLDRWARQEEKRKEARARKARKTPGTLQYEIARRQKKT